MKKNIGDDNSNAITAFSPDAHLIFRATSLSLSQSDQFGRSEPSCITDKDKKCLSTVAGIDDLQ